MPAGYSGTPLWRKLGIGEGTALLALGAPAEYRRWLGPLPAGARIVTRAAGRPRAVHLFATEAAALARALAGWRAQLDPDGFLWVSWPKRASRVATDLSEDAIRALALPLGFVDVKVCAVSEVWSGLKLVVRQSERSRPAASRAGLHPFGWGAPSPRPRGARR
jgi:hypothetical protein